MNFNGYTPYTVSRFGGVVDCEDPTVLPIGVAAVCKNCRFQLTSVFTRFGLQTAMQSPNGDASITGLYGLIYTPENPGDTKFQVPMAFDSDGFLLIENPLGTGRLLRVQGPLVTQPADAHAIITEAYNRALIAYSDLENAMAPINVYGLTTKALDPYGQKPLGGAWQAVTAYVVGEYVQPTATGGNGHLYRCIQTGSSSVGEPAWPLSENGTVVDGGVTWQELTPWLANRLPAPNAPSITRIASGGTFAAGRDVYLIITFTNAQGESLPSGPAVLVATAANDAVQVAIPTLASLIGPIRGLAGSYIPTGCKLYEADVVTGGAAPSNASFGLVGSFGLGATATVVASASGAPPPTANTARVTPGGLQPPQTPTVQRASGAGAFPAGRDVYVIATFTNSIGETLPSVAGSLLNTVLNDAVQVPIPSTLYQITGVKLYECDVATGSPAPAPSSYSLVGTFQPLSTASINASASGPPPPVANTTGPGGSIAPDATDLNGTGVVGLRYASIAFTNRNGNLSGTVPAFTSIFVDIPGEQLYMANIPIGPSNVLNRTVGFTVADGTNVGPFFYIPTAAVSANVLQTATVIPDNTTTTAFFNFTDAFLAAQTSTNMTDRLRCILPPPAVDVYFARSFNRVVLTGVDGYGSGHYISLLNDSESYYRDKSPIQVANGDGQATVCAREFQGALYSLKERSGYSINPNANDPATWEPIQRWAGVGPCGSRAVDVTKDFLFFIHRSGAYAYNPNSSQPIELNTDIPGSAVNGIWNQINWDAEQTIWCCADEETKELRVGVPIGQSTIPNQTLTLNYAGGIGGPVHFTSQDGNEKYLAGAHKWSIDDIAANVAFKMERVLPTNASAFSIMRQSQFLLGSSSPDGTVQQIQMGLYRDGTQGIDAVYETACPPMRGISQLGGVSVDAVGSGSMTRSVIIGGKSVSSPGVGTATPSEVEIKLLDCPLTPEQWDAYDTGASGAQHSYFRMRFTNNKIADSWFGIKQATLWARPLFSGKAGSGK